MRFSRLLAAVFGFWLLLMPGVVAANSGADFTRGLEAFEQGDYTAAAEAFGKLAKLHPASGTLDNLGLTEWRRGRVGPAILAWEQSVWIDPFDERARGNLRYARKAAQLESPDLAWFEVVSGWLPPDYWAWLAGVGVWSAIALTLLPSIFRWRRSAWQQGLAALGIMIFLLSLPAHLGVFTRSKIGFFVVKEAALRLTPTREGQPIARMSPGEPGRRERVRGDYVLVRTNRGTGWVARSEFAELASPCGVQ